MRLEGRKMGIPQMYSRCGWQNHAYPFEGGEGKTKKKSYGCSHQLQSIWNCDILRRGLSMLTCDGSFGDDVRDAVVRRPKPVRV